MAALTNLGFETAGASAGLADLWTLTPVGQVEDIAMFTTVAPALEPWESFELGWGNDAYLTAFVGVGDDLTQAIFYAGPGARTAENFEAGWSNDFYEIELGSSELAVFNGELAEAFGDLDGGWSTSGYKVAFVGFPTDLTIGLFSGGTSSKEDFEANWGQINLGAVSYDTADFDAGLEPFEDFNENWVGFEMTTI